MTADLNAVDGSEQADSQDLSWRRDVAVQEQALRLLAEERLAALRFAKDAARDPYTMLSAPRPYLEARLLREQNDVLRLFFGQHLPAEEETGPDALARVCARAAEARRRAADMFDLDAGYLLDCEGSRSDARPRYPKGALARALTMTLERVSYYERALGALTFSVYELPLGDEESTELAALQGQLAERLWESKRDFCVLYPLLEEPSRRLRLQGRRLWEKIIGGNQSLMHYLSPYGGRGLEDDGDLKAEAHRGLDRL